MNGVSDRAKGMLRLTLTPGLGPVLIGRLLERFGGDIDAIARASALQLRQVPGIGEGRARTLSEGLAISERALTSELARAESMGVTVLAKGDDAYPALLAQLPDSPWVIYVRGDIQPQNSDRFPVGIVGSRQCTSYGLEQAKAFGSSLARSGLTVVSGGARGIDSAAHRGALAAGGRTIAVLGCGLGHCYPAENADLFAQVARSGAVVSELPLDTPPQAENFPARNRIISGLSLGVVVIEAGEASGALITARVAIEEHGREVMALPGRVDSSASRGSLSLLKRGEAALVTEPGDVIAHLEAPARHLHAGTHSIRYAASSDRQQMLLSPATAERVGVLSEVQRQICAELAGAARTLDELFESSGLDAAVLRRELTLLELSGRVRREGSRFAVL
jgi:DNA processing protein